MKTKKNRYKWHDDLQINWKKTKSFLMTCGFLTRLTFLYVFWGSEVPNEVAERPLHNVKCTAWCAISHHGIIGTYWFKNDEKAVTINSEWYIAILLKFTELWDQRKLLTETHSGSSKTVQHPIPQMQA